jgi:hypothetical protein
MFTRIARAIGREFNAISDALIDNAPAYLLAVVLAILVGGGVRLIRELPEAPNHEMTMKEFQDYYAWMP